MTQHTVPLQSSFDFSAIPLGYCQCGCGGKTTISPYTNRREGRYRGQPVRFIQDHSIVRPPVERFWEKVSRGAPEDCWEWRGATVPPWGYGVFTLHTGKIMRSHRFIYEFTNGPLPNSKIFVCHRCDNPPCCNPSHLFAGTHEANMEDMASKGRHFSSTKPESVCRGSAHGNAVLTEEIVEAIRREYRPRIVTKSMLAARYGAGFCTIKDVLSGKSWRHVN